MAIAFVQKSTTADGAASNSLTTSALAASVTAGDCVVAVIESFSGGASATFASSITDNGGNTWPASAAARKGDNNSAGRSVEIWVLPNAAAKASYTLTANFPSGTTETRVTAVEFSGVATSSPVDTSGTAATGSGGAAVNSLAVSTGAAITNGGDLLLTAVHAATGLASSGFTDPTGTTSIEVDQNDASSIGCASAYEILSGASLAVQTLTWNWSAGGAVNADCACIVALLPSGGGGGGVTAHLLSCLGAGA